MRKVFIVVERRADYSRFQPILALLKKDPFFQVHLVVTGICLLKRHGQDIRNIQRDGFAIERTIPMFREHAPDTGGEMVRAMSRFMNAVVQELERAKPDIVLSGFDIGANFAVTVAAAHMNIPVAHIQGGEVTGSIDESIRHAMSKFAHIHFPATVLSKKRLIRMGEDPASIHVVGCPSIDVLVNTPHVPKQTIEQELGVDFSQPIILLIQHPVTTENTSSLRQIQMTIDAIKDLRIQTVALLPNNDAGHARIIKKMKSSGLQWYPSLPTTTFINLYRNVWALVGNSSSGIHETPTLHIPAVNIGTRQQGRERAGNVLDVPYDRVRIRNAVKKALFDTRFRAKIKRMKNPYGNGHSAEKIVRILKRVPLRGIIQKKFYE